MQTNAVLYSLLSLEKTKESTLGNVLAIASVGIAALSMLEQLLPTAAGEVEQESKELSKHFMTLARAVDAHEIRTEPVLEAISHITRGIQFQDRHTQMMEDAGSVLSCYRSMLEEIYRMVEARDEDETLCPATSSRAVDELLSCIRLSDVRTQLLDALAQAKLLNYPDNRAPAIGRESSNDIELFNEGEE